MKKLTKICLLIALILGLTGGVLFVAGILTGPETDTVRSVINNGWWNRFGHEYRDEDFQEQTDTVEKIRDTLNKEPEKIYEYPAKEIWELDIDIRHAYVSVVDSEDHNTVRIKVYHPEDKVEFHKEEGELHIERTHGKRTAEKYPIQVEIPENKEFDSINMELGEGVLEVENLRADEVDAAIGAGTMEVKGTISARKTSLEVGMGTINIREIDSIETEMNCGMGTLDAVLAGSKDRYYAVLESAMGAITLGEEHHSGISSINRGDRTAERTIEIECGMGSVNVNFGE